MAKYIKCDNCGKRIYFGDEIFRFPGNAPLFCSEECYVDAYGEVQELDEALAEDCWRKVYDDDEEVRLRKEIEQTKINIQALEMQLKGLEFELQSYGNH